MITKTDKVEIIPIRVYLTIFFIYLKNKQYPGISNNVLVKPWTKQFQAAINININTIMGK